MNGNVRACISPRLVKKGHILCILLTLKETEIAIRILQKKNCVVVTKTTSLIAFGRALHVLSRSLLVKTS